MGKFEQKIENGLFSSLADVLPISESGCTIKTREQIKDIVELPLLAACEELYDKNIKTLASSANQNDIKIGEAYILIDFDTLSDENKKVAQQYASPEQDNGYWGGGKTVKIAIPISESTTIDYISQKALEIARTFQKQPATWIHKRKIESFTATLDQLRKNFYLDKSEYNDPNTNVWKDLGYDYDPVKKIFYSKERLKYYFDPKEEVYYLSEEHYKKANEENS
jgi:hypothetical protein